MKIIKNLIFQFLIFNFLFIGLSYAQNLNQMSSSEQIQLLEAATPSKKQMLKEYLAETQEGNSESEENKSDERPSLIRNSTQSSQTSSIESKFNSRLQAEDAYSPYLNETKPLTENKDLKSIQFGYSLFDIKFDQSSTFTSIPVGPDYVLGPGDEIIINIWGKIEETFKQVIDKNGKIFIPKIGEIYLSGETLASANQIINNNLKKEFVNFSSNVSVGKLRSIKVFVLGEAQRPGAYDISSLSTLITALYVGGGPTKNGSLRKIKLIRNNKTYKVVDLYNYLLNGDNREDIRLKTNDTIYIPIIGDVVSVQGNVKRPGIFEIEENTNLYDALYVLAGGPDAGFYSGRIQIQRTIKGEKYIAEDVEVSSLQKMKLELSKIKLENGDVVTILPISDVLFKYVTIHGNVARPGKYAMEEGLTILDLIENADNILSGTYTNRVNVYRAVDDTEREILNVDLNSPEAKDFQLKEFDVVKVYSNKEVYGEDTVTIYGAVHKPGSYVLLKNMNIQDLLFLAEKKQNAQLSNIEVSRKSVNGYNDIFVVNLLDKPLVDFKLMNEDLIFVRIDEMKYEKKTVSVSGFIKYPGTYVLKAGERISDVISRAGGISDDAFLKGIDIRRTSVQKFMATGKEKILRSEKRRLIFDQRNIDDSDIDKKNIYEKALAVLDNQINQSAGRIVVKANNWDEFLHSKYNVILEDQDTIFIPQNPSTVQVIGGVQNQSSFIFLNKKAKYYIEQCGGFSDFAVKKNILIFKANGEVTRDTKNIELGDTIYVPEKIKVDKRYLDTIVRITQVLANIATTVLLINNL